MQNYDRKRMENRRAVKYWGEEKKKEIFVKHFIGTHPDYQKKRH